MNADAEAAAPEEEVADPRVGKVHMFRKGYYMLLGFREAPAGIKNKRPFFLEVPVWRFLGNPFANHHYHNRWENQKPETKALIMVRAQRRRDQKARQRLEQQSSKMESLPHA